MGHSRKLEIPDHILVQMSVNARRKLCMTATKLDEKFKFFDHNVPKARVYDLQFPNRYELTVEIYCPIVPPALVHQSDSSNQLILTFITSPADEYSSGGARIFRQTAINLLGKNIKITDEYLLLVKNM